MTKRMAAASAIIVALVACSSTGNKPPQTLAKSSHCVDQTASRLPADSSACSAIGSSYSQEDLRLTGKTNVAEALQRLDPAISAH
jgi:hypothetical protein